ncbi:hypothetical protein [Xanthomonas sp. CFBP 8445]|nr:hypothetical protein [Xanthomonas sp. CFBP 8445]UYC11346.1 hypothetical protein NUG21_16515 [Xanthomonas sp. CFBP 8445]
MSLAEFAGRYSHIAGVIAAAGALPMFFLKWRTGFLGLGETYATPVRTVP